MLKKPTQPLTAFFAYSECLEPFIDMCEGTFTNPSLDIIMLQRDHKAKCSLQFRTVTINTGAELVIVIVLLEVKLLMK